MLLSSSPSSNVIVVDAIVVSFVAVAVVGVFALAIVIIMMAVVVVVAVAAVVEVVVAALQFAYLVKFPQVRAAYVLSTCPYPTFCKAMMLQRCGSDFNRQKHLYSSRSKPHLCAHCSFSSEQLQTLNSTPQTPNSKPASLNPSAEHQFGLGHLWDFSHVAFYK